METSTSSNGGGGHSGHVQRLLNKTGPTIKDFDENEGKQVLDAFFLGKDFVEALNERIEPTVGNFLAQSGCCNLNNKDMYRSFSDPSTVPAAFLTCCCNLSTSFHSTSQPTLQDEISGPPI